MQPYHLRLLNRDGSTDAFELGAFADDSQAAVHAKAALHVSLCAVAGELWRMDARVARILRDCGRTAPSAQPRRMVG
jgi:hypothetical protein